MFSPSFSDAFQKFWEILKNTGSDQLYMDRPIFTWTSTALFFLIAFQYFGILFIGFNVANAPRVFQSCEAGHGLETFGILGTLATLERLETLEALGTMGTLQTLERLGTPKALNTLGASKTFGIGDNGSIGNI